MGPGRARFRDSKKLASDASLRSTSTQNSLSGKKSDTRSSSPGSASPAGNLLQDASLYSSSLDHPLNLNGPASDKSDRSASTSDTANAQRKSTMIDLGKRNDYDDVEMYQDNQPTSDIIVPLPVSSIRAFIPGTSGRVPQSRPAHSFKVKAIGLQRLSAIDSEHTVQTEACDDLNSSPNEGRTGYGSRANELPIDHANSREEVIVPKMMHHRLGAGLTEDSTVSLPFRRDKQRLIATGRLTKRMMVDNVDMPKAKKVRLKNAYGRLYT